MTHDEFKEIVELIGGLSNEMHAGFADIRAEMRAGFADVNARIDSMSPRLDRHAALLQTGSRWVNRMNQWAARIDRIDAERDQRWGSVEKRLDKLEHPPN
jgi:hypothetical protein